MIGKNVRDNIQTQKEKVANWHALSVQEVLDLLSTSDKGLDQSQLKLRLSEYGKNQIKSTNRFEAIKIFFRQFWNLLIILLIGSALIAWYLKDARTAIILAVIVGINVLIGFFEEYRADKIISSLKGLLQPKAKVVREGSPSLIDTIYLVPGDIVKIEAGDSVPADIRIIRSDGLLANNFALTGESTPTESRAEVISEKTALAERKNMIYMGTSISAGAGIGVVVATGMNTELGNIANLSQMNKPDASPLQKEISHLAKRITQGTVILMFILVAVSLRVRFGLTEAFVFAIGIASAMIPQGLPSEVNVALTQAARRLAKDRALVRRLTAVETLGATQIICTDKTGTLTKNEMTVSNIFTLDGLYTVEGSGFSPQGRIIDQLGHQPNKNEIKEIEQLVLAGFCANNASVHAPDSKHQEWYSVGDPTESALITLAKKSELDSINKPLERLKEFAFDSDRKRMSVLVESRSKKILYAKGAPEAILAKSSHIIRDGKVDKITVADRKKVMRYVSEMSSQAKRNLAMAYRIFEDTPVNAEQAEKGLVFLGIASMIDPPRPEVAEAMAAAKRAHMIVTIITGDEAVTAAAIAKQINFADGEDGILIENDRFKKLTNKQIVDYVLTGRAIFARVAPADKLKIVNILKDAGYVLAVTGDGINDAPAIKRADIGVAMGRIGSDVAKESAEIILIDDSFHTLVKAIEQGRVIFQNIRKTVYACLTSNFGELGVVLIGLLLVSIAGYPIVISVPQILAIDLLAELFPLAALGWDTATSNIMANKPRNIKHHIVNAHAIFDVVLSGFFISIVAYANFVLVFVLTGSHIDKTNALLYAQATTCVYLTIVFCQFANVLSRRTAPGQSIFTKYLFTNWHLWASFALSLVCITAIIYIPALAKYFGNGPLAIWQIGLALSGAIIYLIAREIAKVRFKITVS